MSFYEQIRIAARASLMAVAAAVMVYAGYEFDMRRYPQATYHMGQACCLLIMSLAV